MNQYYSGNNQQSTRGEKFNLIGMTADEIRKKILDPYSGNLQLIAMEHPEVIDQLELQFEQDKAMYGRMPVYVSINTNSGLVNTTIRYSDLKRFLPLYKQRPDLVPTNLGAQLARQTQIPLSEGRKSIKASDLFGLPK